MKRRTSKESFSFETIIKETKKLAGREGFLFRADNLEDVLSLIFHFGDGFPVGLVVDITTKREIIRFLFSVRSSSFDFPGERTDIHDVVSQLLAAWLRFSNHPSSVRIWDVPNGFSGIKEELYFRYLLVEQPVESRATDTQSLLKLIHDYLKALSIFELFIQGSWPFTCNNGQLIQDFRYYEKHLWMSKLRKKLPSVKNAGGFLVYERKSPNWIYLRWVSKSKAISIVYSKEFGNKLSGKLIPWAETGTKKVDSPHGVLYYSPASAVGNFVSSEAMQTNAELCRLIGGRTQVPLLHIPVENYLITFAGNLVISMSNDCTRKAFEMERGHLKERHFREAVLFFGQPAVKFSSHLADDEFESLCQDLLSRDPRVSWVRKLGKSRDRDYGCDLLCELAALPLQVAEDIEVEKPKVKRLKIVVQCKAFSSGLGKSKVQDIRDTIEYYKADGYLLMCSSYLTNTLSQHLSRLRYESEYWVDWWTADEIEEKVLNYPDLLKKHRRMFRKL